MALRLSRLVAQDTGVRRAATPAPAPATLAVRPEVVRAIAAATGAAGDRETGGPLFGTVQRSWNGAGFAPLVSVLGTVPPGLDVRGELSSVSLGAEDDGERAASALRWLRRATGLDLVHLGDWHAHPSGACEPSAGDVATAAAMRAESGAPVWLTAIAVGSSERSEDISTVKSTVRSQRTRVVTADVRFYQAVGRGLVPVVASVEESVIPRLPALPWHLAAPVRFSAECRLLDAAGYRLALDGSANDRPGVCLRVQRDGSSPLTVVTDLSYPRTEPEVRDERGRRLALRRAWSPDRFLVDVVREVDR